MVNELIEEFVLGYFISDNMDDLSYEQIIYYMDEHEEIPDGILVWAPFEDYSAESLQNALTDMYASLEDFATSIKKLEENNVQSN